MLLAPREKKRLSGSSASQNPAATSSGRVA
jgi:hypothetical protein